MSRRANRWQGDSFSKWKFYSAIPGQHSFGSDAIVSEVENVQLALKVFEGFLDKAEMFSKLVNENYLTFHRISKGTW
jgi:hypothetical protein